MTVGELIEYLNQYDEDTEVCIGMYQHYGSDFVYNISDVEEGGYYAFYGKDKDNVVLLIEGQQKGTIKKEDNYDDEDDDFEDENFE